MLLERLEKWNKGRDILADLFAGMSLVWALRVSVESMLTFA